MAKHEDRTYLSLVAGIALAIGVGMCTVDAAELQYTQKLAGTHTCTTDTGALVSSHTREDKAIESCSNEALANCGDTYRVPGDGGAYLEIVASDCDAPEPPTCPPVEPCEPCEPCEPTEPPDPPEPPDPWPTPEPGEGFVFSMDYAGQPPTRTATSGLLAANQGTWRACFYLDGEGTAQQNVGLVSRDASGTDEAGHATVRIERGTDVYARLQHSDNTSSILRARGVIQRERIHCVAISFGSKGFALFVDDQLQGWNSDWKRGTAGNSNPLILGASCHSCENGTTQGAQYFLAGAIGLEVYAEQMDWSPPDPPPTPGGGSAAFSWTIPTKNTDGSNYADPKETQVSWRTQTRSGQVTVPHDGRAATVPDFLAGELVRATAKSCNQAGRCSQDSNEVRKQF